MLAAKSGDPPRAVLRKQNTGAQSASRKVSWVARCQRSLASAISAAHLFIQPHAQRKLQALCAGPLAGEGLPVLAAELLDHRRPGARPSANAAVVLTDDFQRATCHRTLKANAMAGRRPTGFGVVLQHLCRHQAPPPQPNTTRRNCCDGQREIGELHRGTCAASATVEHGRQDEEPLQQHIGLKPRSAEQSAIVGGTTAMLNV